MTQIDLAWADSSILFVESKDSFKSYTMHGSFFPGKLIYFLNSVNFHLTRYSAISAVSHISQAELIWTRCSDDYLTVEDSLYWFSQSLELPGSVELNTFLVDFDFHLKDTHKSAHSIENNDFCRNTCLCDKFIMNDSSLILSLVAKHLWKSLNLLVSSW